jgi:peptidoglycan/xylan/chitin deacetylase (PgdA/CDA1 family)
LSTISTSPVMSALFRTIGNAIAPRREGEGRLCIVNYHRILESPDPLLESEPDVATFRWHMELLAKCFHVMPLPEALNALENGCMPPRAVCITFDDGYRSIHDLALPILQEFGLPATVFVASGYITGNATVSNTMWNDRIIEAVRRLPDEELNLTAVGLGRYSLLTEADRKAAANRLTEHSKYLPPDLRLKLTQTIEGLMSDPHKADLMLTQEMVQNMSRQGIEIGGHTVTHPILTSLDDATARSEIVDNKRELEAIIGKPLRVFAYPNGKIGVDFDERHVRMVMEAGYVAACTTSIGAATKGDDRYMLPRCRPWDRTPFMFGARLLYWLMGREP